MTILNKTDQHLSLNWNPIFENWTIFLLTHTYNLCTNHTNLQFFQNYWLNILIFSRQFSGLFPQPVQLYSDFFQKKKKLYLSRPRAVWAGGQKTVIFQAISAN